MNNDARALLSRLITKGIARRLFMDYSNEYSELMNRYLDDELALEETEELAFKLDEKYAQRAVTEL